MMENVPLINYEVSVVSLFIVDPYIDNDLIVLNMTLGLQFRSVVHSALPGKRSVVGSSPT